MAALEKAGRSHVLPSRTHHQIRTRPRNSPTGSDLDWVLGVMTPGPAVSPVKAMPPGRACQGYGLAVIPNADRPRLLVPLGANRAAATAVRPRDFGVGFSTRLMRAALALGLRTGVAQPLLRHRVWLPVGLKEADGGELSLIGHLRTALGRDDVEVAIRIGRARPNGKPLLSIHGSDGMTVGFAKIGWNDATRGFVRTEARVLNELAGRAERIASFDAPRVLHVGPWQGLEILIVSALPARRWTPGAHDGIATAAMREVASLRTPVSERLRHGGYWERQRGRMSRAGGSTLARLAGWLEDRYADDELLLVGCHGDWTPWNIGVGPAGLAVWDWERGGHPAPVGVDAAHFDFHRILASAGKGPHHALDSVLGGGGSMLRSLRLTARRERLALALDLFEMCLRHQESRADGASPTRTPHLAALEALVTRPD